MTSPASPSPGWIGVDFDGTLAVHREQYSMDVLGQAIEPMLFRIRQWLQAGIEVRIFTARASQAELVVAVRKWLQQQQLPDLAITQRRDYNLLQIWDDRAIQLESNTAELLTPKQHINLSISGWMGVELDGTLAHYEKGQSLDVIGEPISKMRMRVQQWLMTGMEVRLFTARAADPAQLPRIKAWLAQQQLGKMKITCEKDFAMAQFWDDRAVHVISNSGQATGRVDQLIPDRKYPPA